VPSGATIISGQGDTTITVNFGTATSGNIIVNSFNGCNYSPTASTLFITLANQLTPAVSLTSNQTGIICIGTSVVFTAIATNTSNNVVNYNFRVNGNSVQNSISNTFNSTTLANGDIVTCGITISGGSCFTNTTATSNNISVLVNTNLATTPSVTIATNSTGSSCVGTAKIFTASSTNIGGGTVYYNFKVNGISIQNTLSNMFNTTTLVNGDIVTCDINVTGGSCLTSNIASSNAITVTVLPSLSAAIAILASSTNICAGTSTTFNATSTNGGNSPVYQWKVNGLNVGVNSNSFTTTNLNNGDIVNCTLNSNAACVSNPISLSNNISIIVNAAPNPSLIVNASNNNVCQNTPITFTATASNTNGATIYQWQLNGVNG
jgi:PKD-like domain